MKTPRFAACAEVMVPVTVPNVKANNKRRISIDKDVLEATQLPACQSIGWLVAKKTKQSTPSYELMDSSSMIPSTNPSDELNLTEISTQQDLDGFIRESLKHPCISLSVFKEKQAILGLAVAWSTDQVNNINSIHLNF